MSKNQKQKKYIPKPKVTPVVATKLCLSFEDAIEQLRSASEIIDQFFGDIELSPDKPLLDQYVAHVAYVASQEWPQLIRKYNIHTSYTITANKVMVRGENNLSFGWEANYDIVNRQAKITSVKVTIIMYDTFEDLKASLDADGWELKERQKKEGK